MGSPFSLAEWSQAITNKLQAAHDYAQDLNNKIHTGTVLTKDVLHLKGI